MARKVFLKMAAKRRRSSLAHSARAARFYLVQCTKTGVGVEIYQITTKILNGHKKYPMAIKWTKRLYKIYQHLPLQGPTKFFRIANFGLKIYDLATLHSAFFLIRRKHTRQGDQMRFCNFCPN
jgi:hypothetical protein